MKVESTESVDMADHSPPSVSVEPQQVVDQLVANHREFLRFVDRRVGNRAVAEEIVQEAFVRSLDRGDEIRDSVIGWFYRVLRNAVVDYQRRQAVASRLRKQVARSCATCAEHGCLDCTCDAAAAKAGT